MIERVREVHAGLEGEEEMEERKKGDKSCLPSLSHPLSLLSLSLFSRSTSWTTFAAN